MHIVNTWANAFIICSTDYINHHNPTSTVSAKITWKNCLYPTNFHINLDVIDIGTWSYLIARLYISNTLNWTVYKLKCLGFMRFSVLTITYTHTVRWIVIITHHTLPTSALATIIHQTTSWINNIIWELGYFKILYLKIYIFNAYLKILF